MLNKVLFAARDEWKSPDCVLGGLVLLAFVIIGKSLVTVVIAGLFWPQATLPLASQVRCTPCYAVHRKRNEA